MTSPQWDPRSRPEPGSPADSGASALPVPVSGHVVPAGHYEPQPPAWNEPVIMAIGDIAITRTHVIVPSGRFPLRGTVWTVQDSTQVTESIPAWAIVLTVIFVWFCLFGLLFLLVKQRRHSGFVSVTVTGPGLFHAVQFPPGPQTSAMVAYQVNQARALAAVA